jgi:hypothetical protein
VRRIGLALAVLLVAAAATAAWVVPSRIDWQARRAEVEAAASAVLDRPVRIEGKFALRLLPSTRVSAINLVVDDVGDGFSARAQEVRLALKFWPLLAGRVVATEVVLVSPMITLSGLSPPMFPAELAPAWIAQAQVRIVDGTLKLGAMTVRGVDARLSGEGPGGPFALEGEATAAGRRVKIAAALGRSGFDGTASLEATLATTQGPATELRAVGLLALPTLTFTGRAVASTADLAAFMPAPPGPARAEATLIATPDRIAAGELALDLAGVGATGGISVGLAPASLDLTLAFARIDLDAWAGQLAGLVGGSLLPIGLDLSAEAATWRGAPMRGLRVAARLADGQAAINSASALLPGNTQLALSGAASRGDAGLRFEGQAQLETSALRTTMSWLGIKADWVAPLGLRQARGTAQLTLGQGLLEIRELDGTLDGVRLAGGLVVQTAGPRPALGVGLTLERFEPEALLTEAARTQEGLVAALRGFDANIRLETPLLVLRGPFARDISARDASLDATLEAGRLVVRRLAVGDLLGARLATGFTLLAPPPTTGPAAPDPPPPGLGVRLQALRLELDAADAAGLHALVPQAMPRALFQGPALLRVAGQAAEQALAVELEAELAGARAEARGTLDITQARFAGATTLRHPGARRWLNTLGWTGLAGWVGDGSLSLRAQVDAAPRRIAAAAFELGAGAARASGALTLLRPADAPPALSGRIALESVLVPLPAAGATAVLPFAALAGWTADLALRAQQVQLGPLLLDQPEAQLLLADNTLRLNNLAAMLAGGRLEAQLEAAMAGPQPLLTGTLGLAGATVTAPLSGGALDLAAGRLDLAARLSARGFAPAALVATLAGEGQVSVRQGVLAGFDLAAVVAALQAPARPQDALARVRAALSGGATAFERLGGEFRLESGAVGFEAASMATEAGSAGLAGTLDLAAGTVDVRAQLEPTGAEPLPAIGMRLSGPAATPRRSFDTVEAARWLSDRPAP